ncbi:hypothetical protein DMC30DRAFT_256078 [Rhodotorula diobovata]|uniref:ubiquitinyl hydrolase 1 n=1 Tax=Rhodotorula diobovata TaxID=5288 RepID=A0A5C5FTV0_9BASI|nr:hypothetical protein DMC30DRAFT_256078 [Rhodotorula diobovata]
MAAPSPGPSRQPTPSSSSQSLVGNSSASSSSLSTRGPAPAHQGPSSKLNPNVASFSFAHQFQPPHGGVAPPPPPPSSSFAAGAYDGFPIPSAGMYGGAAGGYQHYPISSSNGYNTPMHPQQQQQQQQPPPPPPPPPQGWAPPPPPTKGGWGQQQQQQQQGGAGPYGQHHAMHHHPHHHHPAHAQSPYFAQHPPPPPPPPSQPPPRIPSGPGPAPNGIYLPLAHNGPHHLAAAVAAAGYPPTGATAAAVSPVPSALHLPPGAAAALSPLQQQQQLPHPPLHQHTAALLPPFSPQRPHPPSSAPQILPAPSLPVSPASPLPPPSHVPLSVPPSQLPPSSVASLASPPPRSTARDEPITAPSDAARPFSPATTSADQGPPRRGGIRRRRDHLPAPADLPACTFAPGLRRPAGFATATAAAKPQTQGASSTQTTFRVEDSLKKGASAGGKSVPTTPGKAEARSPSVEAQAVPPAATSSAQAPAPAPVAAPQAPQTPKQPAAKASAAPIAAAATPRQPAAPTTAPAPATPAAAPAPAPAPVPASTVAEPATPSAAAAAPMSPSATSATPKSPAPAAAPVRKSWADLVRPPPGSAPPALSNGLSPISASTSTSATSPPAPAPAAGSLAALLALPLAHAHYPAPPVPRGLINNGNLCFANAILQALVYCGDLWNLMGLVERGSKKDLREAMGAAPGTGTKEGKGEKSVVEAMIAFLAEFRNASSSTAPAFDPSQNTSLSASASASASASTSGATTPKPPYNNNVHPLSSSASSSSATPSGSAPAPLSPTPIHDALRHNPRFDAMRRGTQEDAEEFLGFFLETLHEEVLAILEEQERKEKKGKAREDAAASGAGDEGWNEVGSKGRVATTRTTETKESPLTRIFGGKLRSVLRCPGQKDSVTIEPFQRLQLDIQPEHVLSIEDALRNLTASESLPDFVTSRGIRTQDATKHVQLDALPPVLILHLKRFLFDEVGGVQKSGKKVAYGTELTIDERVLSAPLRQQVGKDGARYELFGVVYHHGLHASGGHYTVAVRRGYHSTQWVELDDTHLYPLSPADVSVSLALAKSRRWETAGGGPARSGIEDVEGGDHKCAYLLLYAKVDDGHGLAPAR